MSDDVSRDSPIQPPKIHRAANIGRAALKGLLGTVPLAGSVLAEAAELGLPNPSENERHRWEGEVTDGVNTLHGRLNELDERSGEHLVTLVGGTAVAAKYLVEHCGDGLAHDYVQAATIAHADPDASFEEIVDGLAELESYGLIEPLDVIGGHHTYCLTEGAYEVLDPPLMGWDTHSDARAIASWTLGRESDVEVSALSEAMGWPNRRLNPALRLVLQLIEPDNISRELQPDFATNCFYLSGADRARLRRFMARG
jgi:hypothetical protein